MGRVIHMMAGVAHPTTYARKIGRIGMCRYAEEFYRAAVKTGSLPVRAHLLGHALELYLKTYLLNRGMELRPLTRRPYGHDLAQLLDECIKRGMEKHFRISAALRMDISCFSAVYASKGLEYFSLTYLFVPPKLPSLDRIQRFLAQLDGKMLQSTQDST
jgi:hypothetical protein